MVTLTPVTEQTTDELEIRPELHTTAGKLDDFRDRNRQATVVVAENAAEKQHKRGRKSARERIEMLFDEGSFVELDEDTLTVHLVCGDPIRLVS